MGRGRGVHRRPWDWRSAVVQWQQDEGRCRSQKADPQPGSALRDSTHTEMPPAWSITLVAGCWNQQVPNTFIPCLEALHPGISFPLSDGLWAGAI